MNCYCGQKQTFANCCEPIHKNIALAKTAEQLMRSRYSAYVMANGKYLTLSHHKTTRPSRNEMKDIVKWAKSVEWIQLDVLETTKGTENDTEGTVTFKAFFFENGRVNKYHK